MIGDPVKFCTFRIFACTPCKFPLSANTRNGFLGWGGVGCNDMHCTCTHVRCYAIVLAHIFDATQLHLHTCSMLRNCTCAHVRCYAIALAHMFEGKFAQLSPAAGLGEEEVDPEVPDPLPSSRTFSMNDGTSMQVRGSVEMVEA